MCQSALKEDSSFVVVHPPFSQKHPLSLLWSLGFSAKVLKREKINKLILYKGVDFVKHCPLNFPGGSGLWWLLIWNPASSAPSSKGGSPSFGSSQRGAVWLLFTSEASVLSMEESSPLFPESAFTTGIMWFWLGITTGEGAITSKMESYQASQARGPLVDNDCLKENTKTSQLEKGVRDAISNKWLSF